MEATCSSETSVDFQWTAQRYSPEHFGDINCCPGCDDSIGVQLPSVTFELLQNFKSLTHEAQVNNFFLRIRVLPYRKRTVFTLPS
jgi:hypothetical protein